MAPEQLENHPDEIDSRVDVYALGIIMFYILSKSKPFSTADSNIATLLDLKRNGTPSLEEWTRNNPEALPIPKALIDICDKAIAHNAAERFANTKSMQDALQAWLDGKEQEDKARAIIDEINDLKQTIHSLTFQEELHDEINTPGLEDSVLPESWWQSWDALQEIRQQIDSLHDLIYQKIQGASLYAPHLQTVYIMLLGIEYTNYLNALRDGHHRSIIAGQRRFEVYLAHLQPHKRQEWEDRLAIDWQSIEAYNHGISIHRHQESTRICTLLENHSWVSIVGLAEMAKHIWLGKLVRTVQR